MRLVFGSSSSISSSVIKSTSHNFCSYPFIRQIIDCQSSSFTPSMAWHSKFCTSTVLDVELFAFTYCFNTGQIISNGFNSLWYGGTLKTILLASFAISSTTYVLNLEKIIQTKNYFHL